MKKKLLAIILSIIGIMIPIATTLALVYSATVTVNNSSTAIAEFPFLFSLNTTSLVSGHYISSTGLDTKVMSGSTELPSLLADDKLLFASPCPSGTSTYSLLTGQTAKSAFQILTGYGGYVEVPDNADIEPGNNFAYTFSGLYLDMSQPNGTILFDKPDGAQHALVGYKSATGNITATIEGTGSSSSPASGIVVSQADTGHTHAEYNNGRKFATMSNGTLVATFTDYDSITFGESVYISYSTDKGATWSAKNKVNPSLGDANYTGSNAGFPSIAIDSTDAIWVAWIDIDSEALYLREKIISTWENAIPITSHGALTGFWVTTSQSPAIAVDSNDTVHLAWESSSTGEDAPYGHALCYTSVIGGVSNPIEIVTSEEGAGVAQKDISIAIDSHNYVHVFWTYRENVTYYEQARYAEKIGSWTNFTDITEITDSPSYDTGSIAIDSDDGVHLVWDSLDSEAGVMVTYYDYKAEGGTFDAPLSLTPGDVLGNYFASISIRQDDTVDVAYGNDDGAILHRVYDGTWHNAEIIDDNVDFYNEDANLLWARWPITSIPNGFGLIYSAYGTTDEVHSYTEIADSGTITTSVTVTGVNSGYYIAAECSLTAGTFRLNIGALSASTAFAGSVANTADNLLVGSALVPYMNKFAISKTGSEVLRYEPNAIIIGTTLPDRDSTQNGIIHWGANLGTITGSVSGFTPASVANASGNHPDVLPPINVDLTDNKTAPMEKTAVVNIPGISPMVSVWSTMWGFNTDNIGWVFIAMLLTVAVFWVLAWKLEHPGYAMIGASIVIGFFSIPSVAVIPWGGLFIAALGLVAGTLVEVRA